MLDGNLTINEFIDRLGSKDAVPGGGGAAALTASLGISLCKMAANLTVGKKKFADVGLVPGSELLLEAQAPFGGLIRVRVMESSMALHRDDAADILLREVQNA